MFRSCVVPMSIWALGSLASREAESAESLRLVAMVGDEAVEQWTNKNGELHVEREGEWKPVGPEVRWELRGDLGKHRTNLAFAPPHRSVTVPALPSTTDARTRTYAIVRVPRQWAWETEGLDGSTIVAVWLVDGRPVRVVPTPAVNGSGPSRAYLAVFAFELDEAEKRGMPAVLASRDGRWLTPAPVFAEGAANAVLTELHLGSAEGVQREIARLKRGRVESHPQYGFGQLIRYAAAAGDVQAVGALLDRGAKPILAAIGAAGANDRRACVQALLHAGGTPHVRYKDSRSTPFLTTIESGHVHAAFAMLGKQRGLSLELLFSAAAIQGELEMAQRLAPLSRRPIAATLDDDARIAAVTTGDAELVEFLVRSGMRADASARKIPLLVMAAASGAEEVVSVLVAAGAKVDRQARGGVSPLMAAAYNGHMGAVHALLGAGADIHQKDSAGRSAAAYAASRGYATIAGILNSKGASSVANTTALDVEDAVLKRIDVFRADEDQVLPETAVDLPPVVALEVRPRTSTRAHTTVQPTYTRTTMTHALEPGSPVSHITVVEMQPSGWSQEMGDHWAVVSLVVEKDGAPSRVQAIDAVSAEFATDVVNAVRRFRFQPGTKDGVAVRTRITLPITLDR